MNWDYTPYSAALHDTAILAAGVAFLLVHRKRTPTALILILLMCAVAEWSFTSGMEAASVGLARKIIWAKIEYLGEVSA